jgi:hypothetical protein
MRRKYGTSESSKVIIWKRGRGGPNNASIQVLFFNLSGLLIKFRMFLTHLEF